MSIDRIKQLEARVAQAKKDVRATMSIAELSKESVRDIVQEVGETQSYLSSLFGRSDRELKSSTISLRNEIRELVQEGTDADAKRLKDIRNRIKDISSVASEAGDDEGEFIREYGQAAMSGMKRARKFALRGEGGDRDPFGKGLFRTVLGSGVADWMANTDRPGASSRKRSRAELRLRSAEQDLDSEMSGVTPAQQEEERREGEVRQKEIKQKENLVINLLEEIRDNTKFLLTGAGGGIMINGDEAGGGAGADGGGGGLLSSVFNLDNLLMATMLGSPIKGIASRIVASRAGQGVAGLLGLGARSNEMRMANKLFGLRHGIQGFSAARSTAPGVGSRMAKLSGAARALGGSRIFAGLISFGITEALWQVGSAFIDHYNDEVGRASGVLDSGGMSFDDATGITRSSTVGVEYDMFGQPIPGTGAVIYDPSAKPMMREGVSGTLIEETSQQSIARGQLRVNEKEILNRIELALELRKTGIKNPYTGEMEHDDTRANNLLLEAQGLIEDRGRMVFSYGPKDAHEAVKMMKFSKNNYNVMLARLGSLKNTTNVYETTDHGYITQTEDWVKMLNPDSINQQFWQDFRTHGLSANEAKIRMMDKAGFDMKPQTLHRAPHEGGSITNFIPQRRQDAAAEERRIRQQQGDTRTDFEIKRDSGMLPYDTFDDEGNRIPGYLNPNSPKYNDGKKPQQVSMLPSVNNIPRVMKLDRNASGIFDSNLLAMGGGMQEAQMALVNAPRMSMQNNTNYFSDNFDTPFSDADRTRMLNGMNNNIYA